MISAGLPAASELRAWYDELHARPELAGQEAATGAWLARWLSQSGLHVHAGIGGHAVVGVFVNGTGPVIAMRAEMDALRFAPEPVSEPHRKAQDGDPNPVSHACGHDLHMAAVMGAVAALTGQPESWSGTLVVIFQPAEETGEGAARLAAAGLDRLLPRVDSLLALHTSALPVGVTTFRPGQMTNAGANLDVTFESPSGHAAFGSEPHALDAALRWVAKVREQGVPGVQVGALNSGSCANVIPDSARLAVSVRSADLDDCFARVRDLRELAHHLAGPEGGTDVRVRGSFPPVVNGESIGAAVYQALTSAGEEVYLLAEPSPTCDDVGVLAEHLGAELGYWFVGCMDRRRFSEDDLARVASGHQPREVPGHHSRDFAPSPDFLEVGARQLTLAASALLGEPSRIRVRLPR